MGAATERPGGWRRVLGGLVCISVTCAGPSPAQAVPIGDGSLAPIDLRNGVEVWVDGQGPAGLIAVRLEFDIAAGWPEGGPPGAQGVLAGWLVRGGSPNLPAGGLEGAAHDGGLETLVHFGPGTVGITLVGPEASLERAAWLLGERIQAGVPGGDDVAPARAVIEALAHDHQRSAVSPLGDPVETLRRHMLGDDGRDGPFASLLAARRLPDDELLSRMGEAGRLPVRVVLVVPPALLERALGLVPREFAGGQVRPPPRRRDPQLSESGVAMKGGRLRYPNNRDSRYLLLVGWDLRGAWAQRRATLLERDVALMVLGEWLAHSGNPIRRTTVYEHALARSLSVDVDDGEHPSLVIQAEARSPQTDDVARLLIDEVGRLREGVVPHGELRGAGEAAAQRVRRQLRGASARARAIAALAHRGHIHPYAWVEATLSVLENMDSERISELLKSGLEPERRLVAEFVPVAPREEDLVVIDDATMEVYLRLLVDLRCPARDSEMNIQTILEGKYDMSPGRYMAVTRAITRRPELMRRLVGEADATCEEYVRLRGILAAPDVVAMFEAVACQAWPLDGRSRSRRLARIYRRFDIDASWRRPLVEMTREDARYGVAISAIDERCPEPVGAL